MIRGEMMHNKLPWSDKYVCYFYVLNEKVVYVGKAAKTLSARVKRHAKEQRFQPYLRGCEIRYVTYDSQSDIDIAQKLYIKTYKPILNKQCITSAYFPESTLNLHDLPLYDEQMIKEHDRQTKTQKLSHIRELSEKRTNRVLDSVSFYIDRVKRQLLKAKCCGLYVTAEHPAKREALMRIKNAVEENCRVLKSEVVECDRDGRCRTEWMLDVTTSMAKYIREYAEKTNFHDMCQDLQKDDVLYLQEKKG